MNARDPRRALAARRNARAGRTVSPVFKAATCSRPEPRVVVVGRLGRPDPLATVGERPHAEQQAVIGHVLAACLDRLEREASSYSQEVAAWARTVHRLAFDERTNASSVHEACAEAGSPIDRRFKQSLGLGVRAYLERVRLRAARVLLTQTEVALQDLALAVGYANYETFNRAIKRKLGRSPSQVRSDSKSGQGDRLKRAGLDKTAERYDVLVRGGDVKEERQRGSTSGSALWGQTGPPPTQRRRRRVGKRGGPSAHHQPPTPGLMTITDVKGYPDPDGGVSRIDVEGDSPLLDKLEVTIEVTGKQLKRSVSVRKDRTWTARFKHSDGVDLLGFNCGTLVKAGASSKGDAPQHVVWTGCVRCSDAEEDARGASAEQEDQDNAPPGTQATAHSSDGQPVDQAGQPVEGSAEPLVLVRRGEGDGDQAVVTVTVGRQASGAAERQGPRTARPETTAKRTRRRSNRTPQDRREAGDRYHEDRHDDAGRDEEPQRRSGPIGRRSQPDTDYRGAHHDGAPDDYEDARDSRDEAQQHRQESRGRRDEQERRPRDDRQRQDADEDQRGSEGSGREPVSWIKGSLVMTTTALLLVAIAAQAYPIMVGLAALFAVPTWALVLAGHTPSSWARWTAAGVGLAGLAIPGSMAFVDFIGADVYLVAAGIAALGIAVAAGLLFFRSGDDEDDGDERED